MAVHQNDIARALPVQVGHNIAHHQREGMGRQVDRTAEAMPATRARLGLHAIGQRRGHEAANRPRGAFADGCGQDRIDAKRHVPPVLFGGPERQEDGPAGTETLFRFGPRQVGKEDGHVWPFKASPRRHWRQGIVR